MTEDASKPTCFIAMPITTHEHERERYRGDEHHWSHTMETIFVPAIVEAGFEPIRPAAVGSHMIHGQIIRHLATADMVLCDLSSHNPNVFFELGVRTSLNLPIALVRDEHTDLPFDTSGLNTLKYSSTLDAWDTKAEVAALSAHLVDCVRSSDGKNPMWQHFGVQIVAEKPSSSTDESPTDAQIQLIYEAINGLQHRLESGSVETNRGSKSLAHTGRVSERAWSFGQVIADDYNLRLVEVSGDNAKQTVRVSLDPGDTLGFDERSIQDAPDHLLAGIAHLFGLEMIKITGTKSGAWVLNLRDTQSATILSGEWIRHSVPRR